MNRKLRLATLVLVGLLLAVSVTAQPNSQGHDGKSIAAAIQQASPGDTIRLPEGTYELDGPVELKSGMKLIGASQDKTTLIYRGTNRSRLISIDGCENVEIAHLTLDGRNNPSVVEGVFAKNSRRLWLHHLTIRNLAKSDTFGPHGILFSGRNPTTEEGVTDSRITDCLIENIGLEAKFGSGIRMAWGSVRNQVLRNVVRNTGRGGIFGSRSAELVIRENRVSGSGGSGLGIEIWGGCPRSLIEDNVIDHWLSVDRSSQSAVRRNTIGTEDGTLKAIGIEVIARDVVVTDNVVMRGAQVGLSVSNKSVKNNIFWGYNTVRECNQWGAQLQGESGGIAHHYFYRCTFTDTVRGDPRARYPDSGHGFRTNGSCRGLVFEQCAFDRNGGHGVQLGGPKVDVLDFRRSTIQGNAMNAVTGPREYTALTFTDCRVQGNKSDHLPDVRPFGTAAPTADFRIPATIRAGEPVQFQCTSRTERSKIAEWLWDFGQGIPETTANPQHTFDQPGKYRVTLIVWDEADRGARAERIIEVTDSRLPSSP